VCQVPAVSALSSQRRQRIAQDQEGKTRPSLRHARTLTPSFRPFCCNRARVARRFGPLITSGLSRAPNHANDRQKPHTIASPTPDSARDHGSRAQLHELNARRQGGSADLVCDGQAELEDNLSRGQGLLRANSNEVLTPVGRLIVNPGPDDVAARIVREVKPWPGTTAPPSLRARETRAAVPCFPTRRTRS